MLPGKRGLRAAEAVKEAPRTLVWKALGFWPPLLCVSWMLAGPNAYTHTPLKTAIFEDRS